MTATHCPSCDSPVLDAGPRAMGPRFTCLDSLCPFHRGFALELPDMDRFFAVPLNAFDEPVWDLAVQLRPDATIPQGLPVVRR